MDLVGTQRFKLPSFECAKRFLKPDMAKRANEREKGREVSVLLFLGEAVQNKICDDFAALPVAEDIRSRDVECLKRRRTQLDDVLISSHSSSCSQQHESVCCCASSLSSAVCFWI